MKIKSTINKCSSKQTTLFICYQLEYYKLKMVELLGFVTLILVLPVDDTKTRGILYSISTLFVCVFVCMYMYFYVCLCVCVCVCVYFVPTSPVLILYILHLIKQEILHYSCFPLLTI